MSCGCPWQVSSGGVWLKHSGRVGSAAAFGAGCWAVDGEPSSVSYTEPEGPEESGRDLRQMLPSLGSASVAASVSGVGEEVMQRLLAQQVCLALASEDATPEQAAELLGGSGASGGGGASEVSGEANGGLDDEATRCGDDGPSAGVIALRCAAAGRIEWLVAHSTPSFAVGLVSDSQQAPTAFISRREPGVTTPRVLCSSVS